MTFEKRVFIRFIEISTLSSENFKNKKTCYFSLLYYNLLNVDEFLLSNLRCFVVMLKENAAKGFFFENLYVREAVKRKILQYLFDDNSVVAKGP